MRGMNLPNLPAPPTTVDECLKLYAQRLELGGMLFPRASQLLVAYMAWPNVRRDRDRWMATNLAFFLAEQSSSNSPSMGQIAFDLFGGLRTVADASFSLMMKKLKSNSRTVAARR